MKGRLLVTLFLSSLILFLLFAGAQAAHAESFCSTKDTSACEIDEGHLTLDPLETDAFLSEANDQVCIVYFYSDTCGHCAKVKPLLDELEQRYSPKIRLTRYEVSDPENIKLYNRLCSLRGYEGKKIPLIGINDRILVGEDQIASELEDEILKGMASEHKICPLGGDVCHVTGKNMSGGNSDNLIPGLKDLAITSVLPIITIAGLTDGINPCAFIILIFVMVFLQKISGNKKRLLKVTLTYIITLFLTNTALGILYFTLSVKIGFPEAIRYAVIAISFIAGMINIKDFFWYGKGISLGIPKHAKKHLQLLINKASVPASFVLGFTVAILEAPCSVPIYLAVIEVLKGEGNSLAGVMPHILIYNLMFIIPLVTLAVAVYKGFSVRLIEERSIRGKRWMKLAIGLILLMLAVALFRGWL